MTFEDPILEQVDSATALKEPATENKYSVNQQINVGRIELDNPTTDRDANLIESLLSKESNNGGVSQACASNYTATRKMSPMQEKLLSEQRWQRNLAQLDEILSEKSVPYQGQFNNELFLATFKDENVLVLFFKLFDWEGKGKFTQGKFIDFARRTIQCSNGGREWVELLEVLAYVICEEEGDVTESHFIKIFTSKKVIPKFYKYIDKDGGGSVTRQEIMDLIANLTYARPQNNFNKESLERFENLFRQTLGSKQELTFDDFKKIVKSKNAFFADRVFQIFDRDKSGSVSLCEFLDAMQKFTGKSTNEKIKFLFRVYDLDGDGLIQREELEQVMKACMEENGMKFSHDQIEDLTMALFEDADTEQRGAITYEALKAQLEKHPGLLENLSISIDRWLVPPTPQIKPTTLLEKLKYLRPYQLSLPYLKNNYVYVSFLFFYISVNLGLFIDRANTIANAGGNGYYILARGCGQCLNFNCAFILVLVLRQSITFLRSHGASIFLPLDQNLYLHKICGWVIFFHSSLHTLMHLLNFPLVIVNDPVINANNLTIAQWLLTSDPGIFGLVPGWANPTGIILMIILILMVTFSLSFVRKSGYFEIFYWTHLLYVVFWLLTILHAPHFWKWFIGPAILYLIERIYRVCRMKTRHGKSYISSGILLPSKVIHLVIQRPPGFHYHPGDYVYVNIPTIAKYEWHPFTFSSAPEQDGAVWLHIRAVGEWTNRLHDYFESQQVNCELRNPSKLSFQPIQDTKIKIEIDSENDVRDSDITAIGIENDNKLELHLHPQRKNGISNASFEHEEDSTTLDDPLEDSFNDVLTLKDKINASEAIIDNEFYLDKSRVAQTSSVPNIVRRSMKKQKEQLMRENWKNNSEATLSALAHQNVHGMANDLSSLGSSNSLFPTDRSAVMSVRYMRRKPKVVTLDMPIESDSKSDIETPVQDNLEDKERKIGSANEDVPRDSTAVRRSSGTIFGRKLSRQHPKAVRTISRQESQIRRISRLKEAETFSHCTVGRPLVVNMDGPYGAPSSHIFRAQHAVLIGTGIGVTPFASILQSIMQRYLKARQSCPRCSYAWTSDIPQTVMNLQKVDFFWINRDQRSFEWFVNLLSQLEIEQAEQGGVLDRFLDMHMYITSALQRTDMKAVGLQLALDLLHEKEKRDLITGLKTRTNAGRPNWDKVFNQLTSQNKGKITVFYCGPPALGRILRYKCDDFGFDYRKEIF